MRYFKLFMALFLSTLYLSGPLNADQTVDPQILNLIKGAKCQIGVTVKYNPAYKTIPYPNGDVPTEEGVCTDVIIRAFRTQGIDLQQIIHKDIVANKSKYPNLWKLTKADPNIDHRRVPNLMVLFQSVARVVAESEARPGDIIVWDLCAGPGFWSMGRKLYHRGRQVLHIGILSDQMNGNRPLVIHNISWGVKEEDVLGDYKIIAVYRFSSDAIEKLRALGS